MARNNPSTPAVLGNEWHPANVERVTLNKDFEVGTVIVSTATETVTGGNIFFFNDGLDYPSMYRFHIVEHVYELGQEMDTGKIRQINVPVSSGTLGGSAFLQNAASVQDALNTQGLYNAVGFLPNPVGDNVTVKFNTTSTLAATDRILKVAFRYVLWSETAQAVPTYPDRVFPIATMLLTQNPTPDECVLGLMRGDYVVGQQTLGYKRVVSIGEVNPFSVSGSAVTATNARYPWTIANFQRFASAAAGGLNIVVVPEPDQTANSYLSFLQMVVTVCSENRVGLGGRIFADSGGVGGASSEISTSNNYNMIKPAGTAGWSKQAATSYLVTQHLADAGDGWFIPDAELYFNGSSDHFDVGAPPSIAMPDTIEPFEPHPGYTILRDGNNAPVAEEVTSRIPSQFPLLNAASNDSVRWITYNPGAQFDVVASGSSQNDLIRNRASGSVPYPYVRLMLQAIGDPTGDFVVTVSGSGEQATLTLAEWEALPDVANGWKLATFRFNTPPTFTAAGTDRTLVMSSTTPITSPWWVLAGSINSSQDFQPFPLVLSVLTDVPPVTGFALTANVQPVTGYGYDCEDPPGCIPTGIDYVALSWSPLTTTVSGAAIVTGFGAYEVQRWDEMDPTFRTVGLIDTRAVTGMADFECRYGVETYYRIRATRLDGISSAWVTGGPLTLQWTDALLPAGAFTLTTNADPARNLAYTHVYDGAVEEEFTFVEAGQQTLSTFFNRDYQTAFRPSERGGVTFQRRLLLNKAAVAEYTMDRGFNPIRDLAWASIPYVCVRDKLGNRWFCNVLVPGGTVSGRRDLYLSTVTFTEVTDVPAPVNVCGP